MVAKTLICTVCRIAFDRKVSDIQAGAYRLTCSKVCRYKRVSEKLMGHPVSKKTRKAVGRSNKLIPRHTMKHSAATRARLRFINGERHYGPIKRYFGVTAKRGQLTFTKYQRIRLLAKECGHCGSTSKLELDHIIPWFAGGTQDDSNAQTLCKTCNNRKHREDLIKYTHLVATREAV